MTGTRHTTVYILLILFSLTSIHGFTQQKSDPVIAVVLSGGGAKGFAHIGALKILEEAGLPVDMIIGTSMGAIVGGLYATGYTAQEIEIIAQSEDWGKLLSDNVARGNLSANSKVLKQRYYFSVPFFDNRKPEIPVGAIKGQNVINKFCDLLGNVPKDADFNRLPIRYACVGTNLNNGSEVIIRNGFMPTAIYSSMAIPGVFYPGAHNGYIMVDGGVANNFPTDIAVQMGADIIIGIDIRNDVYKAEDVTSIPKLVDQLINFYSIEKDSVNKSNCRVLIRPDITGFSASSFYDEAVDTLIERGKAAALKQLPEVKNIIKEYKLKPRNYSRRFVKDTIWKIDDIRITGEYSINDKLILSNLNLKTPGKFSYDEIKTAIDRVYGIGTIEKVYFHFETTTEGQKNLVLHVEGKVRTDNLNIGMRLNTRDAISVILNYTQRDYSKMIGLFSATANISSNPGFETFGELSNGRFPVLGLKLEGKRDNYTIFTDGARTSSTELYFGRASLYTYRAFKRKSSIGFALEEELYRGNIFGQLSDSNLRPQVQKTGITQFRFYYHYDILDDYYFPENGSEFQASAMVLEDDKWDNITGIVDFKLRNTVPLDEYATFLFNAYGRVIVSNDPPLMTQTFIGGHTYQLYFRNHLPFYGIPALNLSHTNNFIGHSAMRFSFRQNHYVSVHLNALARSNHITDFNHYDFIFGAAAEYAIRTNLGPLNIVMGYSGWYQKPVISANMGFWF